MKLDPVDKAPDWLKRDPTSGYFWVVLYRATHGRLYKTTKEKVSKLRAISIGERIIAKWLGQDITTGDKPRVYFRDLCDEALVIQEQKLARHTLRKGTLEQARIYIGKILKDEFGQYRVDDLTPKHWQQYVALYQRQHPGKTLYNHWKHLCQVMNLAHKWGYLERAWDVENPDPKKDTGRIITDQEKAALLKVAPRDLRDELIMAMTMGMRLREILYLEWERVDFAERTVTLRPENTKTKKGRVMRMSPQVYKMLLRRHQALKNRSRFVFPSPGNPLRPTHQNKSSWRTAKANAGISGRCRFHHLRHTFLTECAKQVRTGHVSVVLVCAYGGLSIKTFEKVYLHLNHTDTSAVAELIAVKLGEIENDYAIQH